MDCFVAEFIIGPAEGGTPLAPPNYALAFLVERRQRGGDVVDRFWDTTIAAQPLAVRSIGCAHGSMPAAGNARDCLEAFQHVAC